jgi:hypothetical protein
MNQSVASFNKQPLSTGFLNYIAFLATELIPFDGHKESVEILQDFIHAVAKKSLTTPGTLLATIVLLCRINKKLTPIVKDLPVSSSPMPCLRIFLTTLNIASKLLHDRNPGNIRWKNWAAIYADKYANQLGIDDIRHTEKELLLLLVKKKKLAPYFL